MQLDLFLRLFLRRFSFVGLFCMIENTFRRSVSFCSRFWTMFYLGFCIMFFEGCLILKGLKRLSSGWKFTFRLSFILRFVSVIVFSDRASLPVAGLNSKKEVSPPDSGSPCRSPCVCA